MIRAFLLSFLAFFISMSSIAQYSEHVVILWDVTGSLLPQDKGEKDLNGKPLTPYSNGNGMWCDLKKAVIDCVEYVEEDPSNYITIVTFHDHIRDIYTRNATSGGKADLVNFVFNYSYQGHKFTNIVEPVKKFYSLLNHNRINYMFLFTDGDNDAPTTKPHFIPTLDSWTQITKGFNAYGFYVLVHPNANKPSIRNSVESQENFWIVPDAKVRIKICSLPPSIKYNIRDEKGPKLVHMGGKFVGAKGLIKLTAKDPYYDIICDKTPLENGKIQFGIHPKAGLTPPVNHTVILTPTTENTDQYTFVGPSSIHLDVSNIPERSLNLTIDDNDFGETLQYEPFAGLTKESVPAGTNIKVHFSDQAKVENSSAVMKVYFVDKEGNQTLSASSQNLKLYINGEERDQYLLTPKAQDVTITILGEENTKGGTYYGRIELLPSSLDNCNVNGVSEVFKWRFEYTHKWHPLKVALTWLLILLTAAFLLWMLVLKRMFYPTFGGIQKTLSIPEHAPLVIKFKGARKVIIHSRQIKKQSAWNRFWTGKILYKLHPVFDTPLILQPSSRHRILAKSSSGAYNITPNPIPGIGAATIKETKKNLNISVN